MVYNKCLACASAYNVKAIFAFDLHEIFRFDFVEDKYFHVRRKIGKLLRVVVFIAAEI